jgi:PAS domain S-box-containing protein
MIDALPAAIYTTDAEGRLTHFNPACVELSGRTPELGTDHWCVTWKLFHADGTPLPHDQCPMAIALKEGRIVRGVEAIAERPDGTRIWFEPYPTPLFDEAGNLIGGINMLVDITERKRAEAASAYLAAIIESSDDAIISKDLNGVIASWNESAERVFGYTAEEAIGRPVTMLIPPDRQQEEPQILARLRRGERVEHFDTIRIRKDGTPLNVSLTVSPVRDESGRIIGASKVARDITERVRVEQALRESEERAREMAQRQHLLASELSHRVKNTLATVQGIATQTLRATSSKEGFEKAFLGRIALLARTQDLLTHSDWKGAGLDSIARASILPHAPTGEGVGGGVSIEGPHVLLPPKQVVAMSMILHELATNAVKYGALSSEGGRLELNWRTDSSQVAMRWRERGGPSVAIPARRGFGSTLIQRLASFELEGSATVNYAPEGVECEIQFPVTTNTMRAHS